MFKNIILYRLAPEWRPDFSDVQTRLEAQRFVPCGASQEKSLGWVEPRGVDAGPLLESVAGQWVLQLRVETRAVPASVVQRMAQERAAQIQQQSGRKPGKKEMRDLKDEVRLQLLPMAFPKLMSVAVWLDLAAGWLVIDAASQARADEVLTLLAQQLPGFAATLVQTQTSPTAAMADWLLSQEPPQGFSVDRECELKAADESRAVVRYARHRLDIEEVQQHVREGKMPTRLALTWADRVSLVLTEGLQLKKVAFLDGVFEDASTDKADDFDTDVALSTGELNRLLPDLLAALGGEMPLLPASPSATTALVEPPAAPQPAPVAHANVPDADF